MEISVIIIILCVRVPNALCVANKLYSSSVTVHSEKIFASLYYIMNFTSADDRCNCNSRQNVNLNSDLLATRDRPANYRKIFRAQLRHAVLNVGFCKIDHIKRTLSPYFRNLPLLHITIRLHLIWRLLKFMQWLAGKQYLLRRRTRQIRLNAVDR